MRFSASLICFLAASALTCACGSPLDSFAQNQNILCNPATKLARDAVKTYLTTGKRITAPGNLPPLFNRKAAVFVTMAKNDRRRGCKGTFEPATSTLANEIIRSAIAAAIGDIRYRPIRSNELADLTFTVSIVGPLKRVSETGTYSTRSYGLLLRGPAGSGVILPGEAKTDSWRLAEAKRQAGVHRGEPYELFIFETVALHEPAGASHKQRR